MGCVTDIFPYIYNILGLVLQSAGMVHMAYQARLANLAIVRMAVCVTRTMADVLDLALKDIHQEHQVDPVLVRLSSSQRAVTQPQNAK